LQKGEGDRELRKAISIVCALLIALSAFSILSQETRAHDLPSHSLDDYIQPADSDVQNIVRSVCSFPWYLNIEENVEILYYWVCSHIQYKSDSDQWGERDYWQLPNTTITLGTGDCEDQAILLVSLIRGCGIPRDKVHLVCGNVRDLFWNLMGGHCWIEVMLGTGSLEEANASLAPHVGDTFSIHTNETEISSVFTEEKFSELQQAGEGKREGWIPLDTTAQIYPGLLPLPFEAWIWWGYNVYPWIFFINVEILLFEVDSPTAITLDAHPTVVDELFTVLISVTPPSDYDHHDYVICVTKPSGIADFLQDTWGGGNCRDFLYGVDWGTTTDEAGVYTVRVFENWYNPLEECWLMEKVGEISFTVMDVSPPSITILHPKNITYTTNSVSLIFTINESWSWIGYSLDNQVNVTISGNTTLVALSQGLHNIVVYANDTSSNMGASDMVHFLIALPYAPRAEFIVIPETAKAGESVKFDASDSLPGFNGTQTMPITEYRWDFGDGNKMITSTQIVHHSFNTAGNYYVTLTVYAPGAIPETDSITHKVTVASVPVGGYSFPIDVNAIAKPLALSLALVTIVAIALTLIKRKTRRSSKQLEQTL